MPNHTHILLSLLALSGARNAYAEGASWHMNLSPSFGSGQSTTGTMGGAMRSSLGSDIRFQLGNVLLGPTVSVSKEVFSLSEKREGTKLIGNYDVLNWDAGFVAGYAVDESWRFLSRATYGQGDVRALIDRSHSDRFASYRFTNITMQQWQIALLSEWALTDTVAVSLGGSYRMTHFNQSTADYTVSSVVAEPSGGLSLSSRPQEPVSNFFADSLDTKTTSLEAGISFLIW